ncbi:ABC transporter ATP-binding protein [Vibrio sp. WXL103]|uniref:ABC transporter ATP-binding protein n=1 Tax=unclassified Vibrio TaxID=2614977 RepID=UPI003EC93B72
MEHPLVQLVNLAKSFQDGKETHQVLGHINLSIAHGESIALTGASGSGKSTLLNIIGGFETPSRGDLILLGDNTHDWQHQQWSDFRARSLGVIFQQFNLLTPLNVRQNIEFPLTLQGQHWNDWCQHLVASLGIDTLLDRHVASLSGGQQQRVAIARALAHRPKILLADEPTGNLDQHASNEVMRLLIELSAQGNTAIVLVTHSRECAQYMQTQLQLSGGQIDEAN